MTAQNWANLADHVGVLIALITVMGVIIGGMIRYWWYQMDRKIDILITMVQTANKDHAECQRTLAALPHNYVLKTDWAEFHREWKEFLRSREYDWREMWKAFNSHSHDTDGKVTRGNGRIP